MGISKAVFVLSPLLLQLLLIHISSTHGQGERVRVNIGVVLGLESKVGKASKTSIKMALHDFYEHHSNYTTSLSLFWRDSELHVAQAGKRALELIQNMNVQAIIGPQLSTEAEFLANMGSKTKVPIVSFSATSPLLPSTQTPYFIRATLNDSTQAKPLASLFQAYNWRQAVAIYEDTEYGASFIPYLTDALQEIGSRIEHRTALPTSASDELIRTELHALMETQTRVFVVHMTSSMASRLFQNARQLNMMSKDYAWIITDGLAVLLNSMNSTVIASMEGLIGVKAHIPESEALSDLSRRWRSQFKMEYPNETQTVDMNIYALRAYDAAWGLALAVEKCGQFRRPLPTKTTVKSSDFTMPNSSKAGPSLLKAIMDTKFLGVSGDIHFVKGELQASDFQIVNIAGKEVIDIGYWSQETGLSRRKNSGKEKYTATQSDLRPVIWPGRTLAVPRGWVVAPNRKKLRIGIPVNGPFQEFIKNTWNPKKNMTEVQGFCRDVFEAVIDELPYAFPYEFVPFQKADGSSAGTYNDLVYQVYLKNFDAVVGDVTIRANRTNYVDFTLPYTDSGVAMVVPVKKNDLRNNAWVFLKPLTWRLWATSGFFVVLTGFVVWVLEHRRNDDFRGSKWGQIGVVFWFAFSTMVFSHKETVVSNLGRFVVIIWLFVALILNSSYTASLTSILTVQQLQPTVKDIDTLVKNGNYVGCQPRSFVAGLLQRSNFDPTKLRYYNTLDEYAEALNNGEISAYFDEIPYLKLFLSRYCDQFTMVGPIYKTAGLGFVFPKGSPLVSDISKAILNVTEGDQMVRITTFWFGKSYWFGNDSNCQDLSDIPRSKGLSFDSFKGLFIISGTASMSALLIFFITFLSKLFKKERTSPARGLWQRLISIGRHFYEEENALRRRVQRNRDRENPGEGGARNHAKGSTNVKEGESVNHNNFKDDILLLLLMLGILNSCCTQRNNTSPHPNPNPISPEHSIEI
ncbi:glutamate receptor 2.7 [Amborella trichopoda]|uniref:glutamate receptor 2.7 n=1 Tax=Amborella trichopoda TaxID=13333 RepID=UPI0005D45711|nr:glutamate receptor 2.7 [Amborella trichopoda]|eukprot:XP_011623931.1 glutamate receptor 2.7 [Amborella trichopoda]